MKEVLQDLECNQSENLYLKLVDGFYFFPENITSYLQNSVLPYTSSYVISKINTNHLIKCKTYMQSLLFSSNYLDTNSKIAIYNTSYIL